MDADQIRTAFEDAFDQAMVFHGFTDSMRDCELVIQFSADPRTGIAPEYLRSVFVNCVRAEASTSLTPKIWAASLDERLIDYSTGADLDGYVWGVKWQLLYPGVELLEESAVAQFWTDQLGLPFHEASVETNGHDLRLVFSDLRVEAAPAGYTPFVVGAPFWDGKIPL